MIRVLVVDDHDLVRESVVIALGGVGGIQVIGSCADGREAVAWVEEERPDVILMDISMPVLDGIEATRQIVSRWSDARVLMLTASFDGPQVDAARDAGAIGVVFKNARISDVIDGIRRAAQPPRWGTLRPGSSSSQTADDVSGGCEDRAQGAV